MGKKLKARKSRLYKRYSNEFKLKILKKVKAEGLRKVIRKLKICGSTIRSWKESKIINNAAQHKLKLNVGRKISYGKEKEDEIITNLVEKLEEGWVLPSKTFKSLAKRIVNSSTFKASNRWLAGFLRRNSVSLTQNFETLKVLPQ